MKAYLDILRAVYETGKTKPTRTGEDTLSISGAMFQHNMSDGFPLLTSKFVPLRLVAIELEGFIAGITDKAWFQERGCHIWDQWCNPALIPPDLDEDARKEFQLEENDLGPIYGYQWRRFGKPYTSGRPVGDGYEHDPHYEAQSGIDQLAQIIDTLHTNPLDRRMLCTAWHPAFLSRQALPPCHYSFQILSDGETIDLLWNQRSVDTPLGLPFNIASYALLLRLLAHEATMVAGRLVGFLADTHIYNNQLEGVERQLDNSIAALPRVGLTHGDRGIFNWKHTDLEFLTPYIHQDKIAYPVSI